MLPGSYSGNLAAWFRLKYPHLVAGAVASSAPVLAKLNFDSYYKSVTNSLDSKCVSEIRSAMEQFNSLLKTTSGKQQLTKTLNLCTPLESSSQNPKDVSFLIFQFANNFGFAVEGNDNTTGNPLNIQKICSNMTDERNSSLTALDRLAGIMDFVYDGGCVINDYSWIVNSNDSWSDNHREHGKCYFLILFTTKT